MTAMGVDSAQTDFSLLPVEEELKNRLSRLIKLRWVALECILIAVWITEYAFRIPLPSLPLYCICLGIFAYNLFFSVYLKSVETTESAVTFARFAATQIFADWMALALFIHFTGGIESPVLFFFFFHAIVSIILLPLRLFYSFATLGVVFLATVSLLEYTGVINHITLQDFTASPRHQNPIFVFGTLFFFATALYVSTYLSGAIITRLRNRDLELINLVEENRKALFRIQTLYNLSAKISSTLDINEVFSLAARGTAEVMDVKGCSIRILDQSRKKYELVGAYGLTDSYLNKGPVDPDKSLKDTLQGKIVFVADVANDPRVQYPKETLQEGIVTMLALPLIFKNEIIGSLRIHSSVHREFSSEELDFASTVASSVSLAVANAMAYRQLLELDHARSRFMMMVAHEMRAPVSAIQGMLRILLDGYAGAITGKQQELISRAESRTYSFLDLINDLLELGSSRKRIPSGNLTPISLKDVLDKVLGLLEVRSKEKSITVTAEIPPGSLFMNEAAGDMEKLFTNLIGNAVKYTPQGGKVFVTITCDDGGAALIVSDTGIGIPTDDIPRIFEEFYRARNARGIEREGTGLGLPIVKRIVSRYGGEISLASEVSKGTTVTVRFPPGLISTGQM